MHIANILQEADTAAVRMGEHPIGEGKAEKTVYFLSRNLLATRDMALHLRGFGYETFIAENPEQFDTLLNGHRPDAILLETDDEGTATHLWPVLTRIRLRCKRHVPVLFLSSRGNFEAQLSAVRAGVDGYFLKPLDVFALSERLDALILHNDDQPSRILLLGANAERCAYYDGLLSGAGMECLRLQRPAEILRTLARYRPDLILMDARESSCTDVELTSLIRQDKSYADVPIVLLTECDSPEWRRKAITAGADELLMCSIAREDLVFALSARISRYRELRGLIMRDGLTGLYNHAAFKEHLSREIVRSKREKRPLALAMLDLDFFKKINDTYGHQAGDQVIRAIARLLQQRLRHCDYVGRYGGEEFGVILPGAGIGAALGVLNEVREEFQRIRHKVNGKTFSAMFSAGLVEFQDEFGMSDCASMVRLADAALYRAKRAGRNRIEAG